jgi:preprotein translocase subunit SecE
VARDRPVPRRDCFGETPFPSLSLEFSGSNGSAAGTATNMVNPFTFLQDVRAEASKVTWPSRRETLITTGLVIAMVLAASLFFVAVDQGLRLIVGFVLNIGH